VHWLRQDERCHQVLVVQPVGRSASKTDPRDAQGLSELLWVNRERLLRGERVHGVRTVHVPSEAEQADRCLTQVRERLVRGGRKRSIRSTRFCVVAIWSGNSRPRPSKP
jgi:hypothetical protein